MQLVNVAKWAVSKLLDDVACLVADGDGGALAVFM